MHKQILFAILSLFLLLGCSETEQRRTIVGDDLGPFVNTSWKVMSIEGISEVPETATFEILEDELNHVAYLKGYMSCNFFFAAVTISNIHDMEIGEIAVTSRYCGPEYKTLDRAIVDQLRNVTRFRVFGADLQLYDKDGKLLFQCKSVDQAWYDK